MTSEGVKIWRYHVENQRALELNFRFVTRACKEHIRRSQDPPAHLLTRNAALSLGALAECNLMRIVFYPLTGYQLRSGKILEGTIEEAWRRLIDEGFAKKCGLGLGAVPGRLNFTDSARRSELLKIVDGYIVPLILVRNALAHGQWVNGFIETRDRISSEKMVALKGLNLWSLVIRKNLLDKFIEIVESLVISRFQFDRDFDKIIADLHAACGRLEKGDHRKWETMLRDRWKRRPSLLNAE